MFQMYGVSLEERTPCRPTGGLLSDIFVVLAFFVSSAYLVFAFDDVLSVNETIFFAGGIFVGIVLSPAMRVWRLVEELPPLKHVWRPATFLDVIARRWGLLRAFLAITVFLFLGEEAYKMAVH